MTVLFHDTFSGSEPLEGHIPDVPFYTSLAWTNIVGCYQVVSGGYMAEVSPPYNYTLGTATNGVIGTEYGATGPIEVEFTFTTPVDMTPNQGPIYLQIWLNGTTIQGGIRSTTSGGPKWLFTGTGSDPEIDITAELSPSTNYTGIFQISSGVGTFTLLGHVRNYTNVFVDSTGVNKIMTSIGGYSKIQEIKISTLEAETYTINASLTAPAPILFAKFQEPVLFTCPSPTLSFFTGSPVSFIAPSPRLTFYAHDSTGENAANLTAPKPTLVVFTGVVAKLTAPSPTLSCSATVTILATANLTAPRPTLGASVTVTNSITANLQYGNVNGGNYSLKAYCGAVCSVSVAGSPTLQASVTTGSVISAQVTCPLFELVASVSSPNTISANLICPSPEMGRVINAWLTAPSATLVAIGTATITATYEAYAINLGHRPRGNEPPVNEVTHYTNFPFTHVVRYQNSYFGANSTGLYLLEGTTDAGTPIPWSLKTAMDDFNEPVKKTVASSYFGGRFGPASTVQIHAGEETPVTYSYSTPRDALAQNHRQVFGKGTKERYFALGASGTGTCELDTIELETYKTSRRI